MMSLIESKISNIRPGFTPKGPLVGLLAHAIPKISIDLIKLIAQYYDVFSYLDSIQLACYCPVQICTCCQSVDPLNIHFAGSNWTNDPQNNNPTRSLVSCCFCKIDKCDYGAIHSVPKMNLLVRSSKPFIINPNGSFSSSTANPIVSVCSICNDCVIHASLSSDSKPILSMTQYNYIVSRDIAQNRLIFFCPYWLAKATQWIYDKVPPLIAHALLQAPSPFNLAGYVSECKTLNKLQSDLLTKFAYAHIDKLQADVTLCLSCKLPKFYCGICHCIDGRETNYSDFSDIHICKRSFCWGLFFTSEPECHLSLSWCKCD